jgi:hypothetical protein
MWVLYFSKPLKNLVCAQLREIRMNQVISAHAEFQPDISKFLVAFGNENLFEYPAAKGTFLGMSAYLKISVHPQLRFLCRPSISKN